MHIHDSPRILLAFDPIYGLQFLFGHGIIGFVVLGSVFLAVTGAEALYADMGHFGRLPIQCAWLLFVLPALTLNYLGQGALVLANPAAVENPFFLMAPSWALLPLVILSTIATVIASQAVITGAFSLARQAIQLGLLPRMLILHTSETQEGQIYIPRVNRLLLIGVLLLVILFKSSSALASAYGIAVTGTMVVTTCARLCRRLETLALAALGQHSVRLRISGDRPRLPRRQSVEDRRWRMGAPAAGGMRHDRDVDMGARRRIARPQDPPRFDLDAGPYPHAGEIEADKGRRHGGVPHHLARGRAFRLHA